MPCRFRDLALSLAVLLTVGLASESQGAPSPLQMAIDRVERESDGKVLAVQTLERNKRKIYVIKVLTRDGRVKVVQVRATE